MTMGLEIATAAARDGDVYALRLVDKNGNAIVNSQATVRQYETFGGGDPRCRVTCTYASLQY